VHVVVGDRVDVGDPIATLEAMKMEHVVGAGIAGRIERLAVRPGDQVVRGQEVASITVSP
jgi:biotin carboxyl carrier protein